MDRPTFLKSVLNWLRAGYPNGVPQGDYIPLVALLRRQLSEEEVHDVAITLINEARPPAEQISKIDAGVAITKVTEELPAESDVARVRTVLEGAGWPFDDHPLGPPTTTDE
ncbi:DUF3349 domain-containing protein [Gordonia sp. TBRC 11910]|uniref:DUF3349 domain-containing protein n=1 Tax=Gordonia asplenii TaxID=2725283 RepID=A0A848L5L2_9ACTN|nr:DUF3349 domain-containing protein [Gordonia asplenii]NMO03933.1 DUF3349 domain-containing protein [Gordonia asplenii]